MVVASQAINSVELMTSLRARQETAQSDGFRTRFAGRILCSEKATSATPSRHRQEDDDDDEVSTATLISSSWRLCFTSGIILSEGERAVFLASRVLYKLVSRALVVLVPRALPLLVSVLVPFPP